MAKILDQFRQMAFEFLPHDVMVSFHFQIWPWCSLKIGEKVQISHLPSRDADDNEFQLVFMEGKFALLHTSSAISDLEEIYVLSFSLSLS